MEVGGQEQTKEESMKCCLLGHCAHDLTAAVVVYTRPTQINLVNTPVWMGGSHETPPLSEELLAGDSF